MKRKLNKQKIRQWTEAKLIKLIKKEAYKRNKLRSKLVEQDLFISELLTELKRKQDLY